MGWRERMRSLGPLALVVVATGAAHAAVPPVRRWMRARGERIVHADLVRHERALVRCLLGGDVAPGEDLVERVAGIRTALAARGEVAANDASHWPGRCAPLARATVDVAHLGRPSLDRDELETLALVLGAGRPLDGALGAIQAISSPRLGADAETRLVEVVGGDPPRPWSPEISEPSLPEIVGWLPQQPFAVAASRDGMTEAIDRERLPPPQATVGRARTGVRLETTVGGSSASVRSIGLAELPRAFCIVDVGRWSVEACGTSIRAIAASDADRMERGLSPEVIPATLLGVLDPVPVDHPRSMFPCIVGSSVVAVVFPAMTPRRAARIVPVVDGVPGPAWIAPVPADQVRCAADGTVELAGVRVRDGGRLSVERGVCSGGACLGEAADLDDVVPEQLRPDDPDRVAVGMLGDELVVGWIAGRLGTFVKRGRVQELARAPLRLIHRATRGPELTRIDVLSAPRAVALALASGDERSFAFVTIDLSGAADAAAPRRESR